MNLARQKTKVLQSVNSRQGQRTDQPENQESLHLNQSKASITLTGATNQSTMSSAVFRPKSAQLPQVSMSVMTDIENEPETEKGKFPKQNRTYSTAHSEASMGDDFEEKTPQQLLIHPSGPVSRTKIILGRSIWDRPVIPKKEFPQVDSFLGRNRKDSLTKYETRNLPQFLVEKDVNDCDDDAEWKIFFGMILE